MRFFKAKRVPLEVQLQSLADCGLVMTEKSELDDLTAFHDREALEADPYQGIIEVLGIEIERKPLGPICNRLWMCDYERIAGDGDYVEIIRRLELLTGPPLGVAGVSDHVDIERGEAWIEFELHDEVIRWEPEIDNDWMNPYIVVKYDRLLEERNHSSRIYSNHTDFGQSVLFGAFTQGQIKAFRKLSKIRLLPIHDQA